MTNLGLTRLYLGVEFKYFLLRTWLHQWTYIWKIFNMYAMNNCMLKKIPMDPDVKLHKKMGNQIIDLELYISLVGNLIYVTNMWLNICFTMSCVRKYMNEPKENPFTSHQINSKILERHVWLWIISCMQGKWNLFCIYGCGLGMWFGLKISTSRMLHKLKDFVVH